MKRILVAASNRPVIGESSPDARMAEFGRLDDTAHHQQCQLASHCIPDVNPPAHLYTTLPACSAAALCGDAGGRGPWANTLVCPTALIVNLLPVAGTNPTFAIQESRLPKAPIRSCQRQKRLSRFASAGEHATLPYGRRAPRRAVRFPLCVGCDRRCRWRALQFPLGIARAVFGQSTIYTRGRHCRQLSSRPLEVA